MRVKIHFYKGTRFFSRLIQWRTFSQFSHVSIQIADKIYEAKEGEGVVSSVARKDPPHSLVETIEYEITKSKLLEAETWLKLQLGKEYDYMGILLFVGRPKTYALDSKWFCSELGAYFLYKAGVIQKPKMLLSPGALYLLLK